MCKASIVSTHYRNVKVNVVHVTTRAFTVRKDVLPTPQLSKLVYQFECRQCGSRYVGRTIQHLKARVKQHVPLHLLTSEARKQRPRRGRPPRRMGKQSEGLHSSAVTPKVRPLRSCRTQSQRDDVVSNPVGPNVAVSTVCTSARVYDSSVANHLVTVLVVPKRMMTLVLLFCHVLDLVIFFVS